MAKNRHFVAKSESPYLRSPRRHLSRSMGSYFQRQDFDLVHSLVVRIGKELTRIRLQFLVKQKSTLLIFE